VGGGDPGGEGRAVHHLPPDGDQGLPAPLQQGEAPAAPLVPGVGQPGEPPGGRQGGEDCLVVGEDLGRIKWLYHATTPAHYC